MKYRDIIFELFSKSNKKKDTLKDANDKGTLERFNEVIGKDIDTELKPMVDNLQAAVIDPETLAAKYLTYAEDDLGVDLSIGYAERLRRLILQRYQGFVAMKGTKTAFVLLFRMLGYYATINESWVRYRFDSPILLDDPQRVFDLSGCRGCADFTIGLTGSQDYTEETLAAFTSIINFNTPVTSQLTGLRVNATDLAIEAPAKNNNFRYKVTN